MKITGPLSLAAATAALCIPLVALAADPTPEEQAANIAKAVAEAKKAQAEAELATLKARFGTDIAAPHTGAVTTNPLAGSLEASLLSADALRKAAAKIAKHVAASVPAGTDVVVFAAAEVPQFTSLISYRTAKSIFDTAYQQVLEADRGLNGPLRTAAAAPAAALVGLDALNRLLGFFRSDFAITGVDVPADDGMLVQAVAEALSTQEAKRNVRLPMMYNRTAITGAATAILKSLGDLQEKRATIPRYQARAEGKQKDLEEKAKSAKEPEKGKLEKEAAAQKDLADKWKTATGLYDNLFGKMATPDDKGNVQVVNIIKEGAIEQLLACEAPNPCKGQMLVLKTSKANGSFYTRSNLWTSLGAMPFYVAGGAVATYTLFKPDGAVQVAGVLPIHGGYHRVDEVEKSFKGE